MYGMNPHLISQVRSDYSQHLSKTPCIVDCSLGTNPYGCCASLADCHLPLQDIAQYPHSDEPLKEALVVHHASRGLRNPEQVLLTCGSMGGLLTLNRGFLRKGSVVVGMAPQFSAMIDDVRLYQADYRAVPLSAEKNYAFALPPFLEELKTHREALIYIDNPNNPTGQIISLSHIGHIVEEARRHRSFVIVDEAYGEFMAEDNTAIALLDDFENLAVVRSFSKGFGAAGIRLGYVLSNPQTINCLHKVNVPFAMNSYADLVARQLLASTWHLESTARVVNDKARFVSSLKRIGLAHTAPSVSIGTYYVQDRSVDLEGVFDATGMRVVSCRHYDNLGQNFVRINLNQDVERMEACLALAEEALASME